MSLTYVVMTLVQNDGVYRIKSFSDAGKAHLAACRATVNAHTDETILMKVDNDGEEIVKLIYVNGGCSDSYHVNDVEA